MDMDSTPSQTKMDVALSQPSQDDAMAISVSALHAAFHPEAYGQGDSMTASTSRTQTVSVVTRFRSTGLTAGSSQTMTGEESIMGSVNKRIERLTNFETNFAPVLQRTKTATLGYEKRFGPGNSNGSIDKSTFAGVGNFGNFSGAGLNRLFGVTPSTPRSPWSFSFRMAVTGPMTIFVLGVCLGLFLPVVLLSFNATDDMLDSYLLVVGEHRQLVDELLQASLLTEALVQRLSSSVSYVENLARVARQQSEDYKSTVEVFGIVFFIVLVPVTMSFGFISSWLISRGWRVLLHVLNGIDEDSYTMRRLARGQRSRIWDIATLQDCCLSLSRAMQVFVRFVPETTVRNILKGQKQAMTLHVKRRVVTIMFSDIKDFTNISEALNQNDLIFLLTRYFSVMTRIISSFDGVVAEILGDGLLCFWNTPDDCDEHAAKACAAALAMQQALTFLSGEFAKLELPTLAIRIGIHTGRVLTGNIGSELRMKFGCIGDPVNLAARLEGLCKFYKVSVLCSGETFRELPRSGFTCRRLDRVQVKGKNDPTDIYEVIDSEILEPELDDEENDEDNDEVIDYCHDAAAMRSVRTGMRRSMALMKELGTSSADTPGSLKSPVRGNRCTLQVAVAMGAIDDSNKAMTHANACQGMWQPLRDKIESMKNGALALASTASQSLPSVKCQRSEFEAPGRAENSAPAPVTVGGRVSITIDDEMKTAAEQRRNQIRLYENALEAYQEAQFSTAREFLDELLVETPDDGPALRLRNRCNEYIDENGRFIGMSLDDLAKWTGVYNMTEK